MCDRLRPFPSHFCLQNLTKITGSVFEFKVNPFQQAADHAMRIWFDNHNVYEGKKKAKFLSHRFDSYAGFTFPTADTKHLETCIAVFLWAFSFDDLTDEGDLQDSPDGFQRAVDISMNVLLHPEDPCPKYPYAAMLYDIWKRFRETATPGACNRFVRGVECWMQSQVEQSRNRVSDDIPSVQDFIVMRRETFGVRMAEGLIEYSLDIDVPAHVWDHPVLVEISKAASDIMTWPNDICSFNKEQETGDFQNLVFCMMAERDTDLQTALDMLAEMLSQRIADYMNLKKQIPSFGPEIDRELTRYFQAYEHYLQGNVEWYYQSPRYFRGLNVEDKTDLIVPVFQRK